MIKKYLQFINENKDNVVDIEYVLKNKEHIDHKELEKFFFEFENNGFDLSFGDGICNLKNKDFIEYGVNDDKFIDYPIYPNIRYNYYTNITITRTTKTDSIESSEDLQYTLSVFDKVFKAKTGHELLVYQMGEYISLKDVIISDEQYFVDKNTGRECGMIDINLITKEIGFIDAESILRLFNWVGSSTVGVDDNNRIYIDMRYDALSEFTNYEFSDTLGLDREQFINILIDDDVVVEDIFIIEEFLNEDNKKILMDILLEKNEMKQTDNNNVFKNILNIEEYVGAEVVAEIHKMYKIRWFSELWEFTETSLMDVLKSNFNNDAFFIYEKDNTRYIRFYYINSWFKKVYNNFLDFDIKDFTLSDLLEIFLENEPLDLNKKMPDMKRIDMYFDVNIDEFNKAVNEYLKKQL